MIKINDIINSIDNLESSVDIPGLIRKQYFDKLIYQLKESKFEDLSQTINKSSFIFSGLATPDDIKSGTLFQYKFIVLLVTDSHIFLCMYYNYNETNYKIHFSRKYLIDKYITERISVDIDSIVRYNTMSNHIILE